LSVDGEDVGGKSAFEVSSMLQGPSGTFVTLEVNVNLIYHISCNVQIHLCCPILPRMTAIFP